MAGVRAGRPSGSGGENSVFDAENVEIVGPEAGNASLASASGKLLKRSDVARRLGMSLSSVRRMEGSVLKPIVGADGVRYFEETEIQAVFVRIRQSRRPDEDQSHGLLSARVFQRFEEGADPVAVVKELALSPDVVERLYLQWRRLREALVIHRETLAELSGALLCLLPPTDDGAFVEAVAEFKRDSACYCVLCRDRRAYWCRDCAAEQGLASLLEHEARKLF